MPTLARDLESATTLYNTYWVRFAHGRTSHAQAIENSRTLFYAARQAGVQRIVHLSITNPSIESPYPYFRGKAIVAGFEHCRGARVVTLDADLQNPPEEIAKLLASMDAGHDYVGHQAAPSRWPSEAGSGTPSAVSAASMTCASCG